MVQELHKLIQKKSIKNGLWLYVLQTFNTVIPLLTLPYITRILDKSQYGIYSLAINLIGYFQVVVEYGFDMSATRKVALKKNKKEILSNELGRLESTVILSRTVLLLISTVLVIIYVSIFRIGTSQRICIYILLLSLFGCAIQQNWLFQGMQDMKYIAIFNISCRTISAILIFLLVKQASDLYLYCVLFSLSPFLSGIFGLIIARKKYKIAVVSVRCRDIWNELQEGWYVFTTSLSAKVFGAIGTTFLGFYATTAEVGAFTAVQKIPSLIIMAWSPISQVLYPIVSSYFSHSFSDGVTFVKRVRKRILWLFIAMCSMIILFAQPITELLFGASYAENYYWIIPLTAWVLVSINNNFLGVQILLGSGHDKEYSRCFQVSVICTIAFNFLGAYGWGANGIAVAPLLSELLLYFLLRMSVKRISNESE